MVKNIELFSDAKASKALAPTMRQDNLKRAKAKYEENHEDLEAVLAYADALFNNHQFVETEAILEEARSIQETPDILFNLAFVYSINGKHDQAKELYHRVVELAGDTPLGKSAEYELWKMGESIHPKWLRK